VGYPVCREPVAKDEKIEGHSAEGFDVFVGASVCILDSDTGNNRTLVDIQTAAPLMKNFHLLSPLGVAPRGCPFPEKEFTLRAQKQQFKVPLGIRVQLPTGS
jgi:hypothetical protein